MIDEYGSDGENMADTWTVFGDPSVQMRTPGHPDGPDGGGNEEPPVADFSANTTTIEEGETVDFTDQSSNNPTEWDWSFEGGDPSTSTEQNPGVTYQNQGTYEVSLTVTNEYGSDSETKTDYITVEEYVPSYCESKGEDASYEWIDQLQIGDFNNNSGSDNGYGDYTNQTIELTAGQSNNITLTPGFSGSTYQEYWKIWIDFNGDYEFSSDELVYDAGSTSSSEVTGSIDIPSDASGSTRMRVTMKYDGEPTACESFSYGEVEDYTVSFTGGGEDTEAPTAPTNLASSNVTETSVDLTWDASSDNVGVDHYTVLQDGNSVGTTSSTSYSVTGLSAATTYTFTVKAEDAAGNVSSASNAIDVTTNESTVSYCTSNGENTNYEWIDLVELGSISNSTSADGGYADYTNLSTDLTTGSNVTIYFSAGFGSSSYTEYWHVWIDFNHNGEFESSEEVVAGSSSNADNLEASFDVPTDATLGETRMRVTMKYNSEASPCETFNYGEVEDYTVNITEDASNNSLSKRNNATKLGNAPEGLNIYPNPATNYLNVKINEGKRNSVVYIYDTHGKLVKAVSVNTDFKVIDVSELPGGVYILKVNDDRAPLIKEFIKK